MTTYQYNAFGDLMRTTLPRGNVIENGYDAAGRLVSIERKPDAGTPGERTFYTLDAFGHRIKEELQRWDAAYVYSDRDLMTSETSPVSGVTTYAYDEHGELTGEVDARSVSMTRTLDAADRVTLIDYPGTDLDITYTYDDPAVPFSKGRLTRIAREPPLHRPSIRCTQTCSGPAPATRGRRRMTGTTVAISNWRPIWPSVDSGSLSELASIISVYLLHAKAKQPRGMLSA